MFSVLTNLAKAAAAVAVAPVAVVVDVVTLPASANDWNKGPFDRTAKVLGAAGDAVSKAIK